MQNKYFDKKQNTSNKSITMYYYNRFQKNFNNLDFLKNKIDELLNLPEVSDNTKKQLNRLNRVDFDSYDLFFIYSNSFKLGINHKNKIVDFYDNDYQYFVDLDYFKSQNYTINFNVKIKQGGDSKSQNKIDASDFESPESK